VKNLGFTTKYRWAFFFNHYEGRSSLEFQQKSFLDFTSTASFPAHLPNWQTHHLFSSKSHLKGARGVSIFLQGKHPFILGPQNAKNDKGFRRELNNAPLAIQDLIHQHDNACTVSDGMTPSKVTISCGTDSRLHSSLLTADLKGRGLLE